MHEIAKKMSRQKDKIYGPCVFCDVARSDISRHMLSTHKHEQKIIDPAPVNKNECARSSGPNCWKRWPGTPSWRSWRRPNDSPSGEKHIRRAKGEEGKGCTIRRIPRLLQLAKGVETVAALLEVSNFYILQEAIIKMCIEGGKSKPGLKVALCSLIKKAAKGFVTDLYGANRQLEAAQVDIFKKVFHTNYQQMFSAAEYHLKERQQSDNSKPVALANEDHLEQHRYVCSKGSLPKELTWTGGDRPKTHDIRCRGSGFILSRSFKYFNSFISLFYYIKLIYFPGHTVRHGHFDLLRSSSIANESGRLSQIVSRDQS